MENLYRHFTYRKPFVVALALAVVASFALTGVAPRVEAQSVIIPPSVNGWGASYADDTDPWAIIKYVGPATGTTTTQNSGKVEVEADTDMVFLSGAQGSEAADTSLECPVSGALGGIIDVDDAACNTAGEVCDIINASSSNFRCVLVAALRSDVVNDRILLTASTRATTNDGVQLKWDTSTAFEMSALAAPSEYLSASKYITPGSRRVNHNTFGNTRAVVLKAADLSTYGSGTSNLTVYSVKVSNSATPFKSTETVTTLFTEASGASTVAKIFDLGAPVGIVGRAGEKMIVRNVNSAAMATAYLRTYGYFQLVGPPQ